MVNVAVWADSTCTECRPTKGKLPQELVERLKQLLETPEG
jgi:hypothetical protein